MRRDRLLQIISEESALLQATAIGDLDAPLVVYPTWTMLDLLVHTGSVHRRTTRIVRERATERLDRVYPPSEEPDVVPCWFDEGYREMVSVLAAADPGTPVWSFGPELTVGWWITRMALETAVHRWDAERAVGEAVPLDAELATVGIDEFGWIHMPRPDGEAPGAGDMLMLTASDASWVVSVEPERFTLRRSDALVPAQVAGDVAALYLWLMGREQRSVLRSDGDTTVLDWWDGVLRSARPALR